MYHAHIHLSTFLFIYLNLYPVPVANSLYLSLCLSMSIYPSIKWRCEIISDIAMIIMALVVISITIIIVMVVIYTRLIMMLLVRRSTPAMPMLRSRRHQNIKGDTTQSWLLLRERVEGDRNAAPRQRRRRSDYAAGTRSSCKTWGDNTSTGRRKATGNCVRIISRRTTIN